MRLGIKAAALLLLCAAPAWADEPEPPPPHTEQVIGAATILGRPVADVEGQNAGLLVDVIADATGAPIAGVIDVGGFLGVGTRRVAVAWTLLHFAPGPDGARIAMDLTIAAAAAAPAYQGPDGALIIIDHGAP
jgi:PRC-barrel domain